MLLLSFLEWRRIAEAVVLSAAVVGGWRLRRRCEASTGTVYLKLEHAGRGRCVLRLSDHRGGQAAGTVWLLRRSRGRLPMLVDWLEGRRESLPWACGPGRDCGLGR